jgi:hypothetical protein
MRCLVTALLKYLVPGTAVLAGLMTLSSPVLACGYSYDIGGIYTLRQAVDDCDLVIYGKLINAREGPGDGSTDCILETVIKPHPILRGKKVVTLSRHMEIKDPKRPPHFLLFCTLFKGRIEPCWRSVQVSAAVGGYLKGLLAIEDKNHTRRLRYCFDFLDHADREIARDAFDEFMKIPDRELGLAARKLPAAKLRRWLRDPKTEASRSRLYGFLLGNCGTDEDALLLRSLAIRLAKQDKPPQIDGILTGYTLLRPREGWAHIRGLLNNPSGNFALRVAEWRAARYFHYTRPDVIEPKAIVEAFKPALNQSDFADVIIHDLRRWRRWDLTAHVLPLYGRRSPDAQETVRNRRAILCYALRCPDREAVAFIAEQRKTDPAFVQEAEELLKLEKEVN